LADDLLRSRRRSGSGIEESAMQSTDRHTGRRFELSVFDRETAVPLPRYLTRYAAEVDQWHREALAARAARR
jgi:hypothetical protein